MKIGCCLNMNARREPKIGNEAIPLFAELGFDYVELPLAQVMELSAGQFGDLVKDIRSGIPLEACNNFFPASVRLTGGEANPVKALEYAKAAADRAAAMGARVIVLGSSGAKNIPPGFPYEAAASQLKDLLFHINAIAAPLGITIVLEPLNTRESNFITTAEEGLAMAESVALEKIKLLIDYYHLRMEDEDPGIISRAAPMLRHIHIASKEGRRFPRSSDGEDYAAFFSRLKAAGYGGRVSVEGYSEDLAGDGAATLKLLRSLVDG